MHEVNSFKIIIFPIVSPVQKPKQMRSEWHSLWLTNNCLMWWTCTYLSSHSVEASHNCEVRTL